MVIYDFITEFWSHTSFDYFLSLAEDWAIEGIAPEISEKFHSALAYALNMMYSATGDILAPVRTRAWEIMMGVALAFIPLVIALNILETLKMGIRGPMLRSLAVESVVYLLISIGLAVSSKFLIDKILVVSVDIGERILRSGASSSYKSAGNLADFILPGIVISPSISASGTVLSIVFIFMRLLVVLMVFFIILIAAFSNNLLITLLIGMAPFVFIVSAFQELGFVRSAWIKTFIGCSLLPTIDALLLLLIIKQNGALGLMPNMGELLAGLIFALGIASAMLGIHNTVLSMLMTAIAHGVNDLKKATKAVVDIAAFVGGLALGGMTGGASLAASGASAAGGAASGTAGSAALGGSAAGSSIGGFSSIISSMMSGNSAVRSFRNGQAVGTILSGLDPKNSEDALTMAAQAAKEEKEKEKETQKQNEEKENKEDKINNTINRMDQLMRQKYGRSLDDVGAEYGHENIRKELEEDMARYKKARDTGTPYYINDSEINRELRDRDGNRLIPYIGQVSHKMIMDNAVDEDEILNNGSGWFDSLIPPGVL